MLFAAKLHYKCLFCSWSCKKKSGVERHMLVHTSRPDSLMPQVEQNFVKENFSTKQQHQPLSLQFSPPSAFVPPSVVHPLIPHSMLVPPSLQPPPTSQGNQQQMAALLSIVYSMNPMAAAAAAAAAATLPSLFGNATRNATLAEPVLPPPSPMINSNSSMFSPNLSALQQVRIILENFCKKERNEEFKRNTVH